MLTEQLAKLRSLRVLITIESGDPQLNKAAAEFLAGALKGPLELKAGDAVITLSFAWSLASRAAEMIKADGDSVLDFDIEKDKAIIVTRRGYIVIIRVEARSIGYVSEIEGLVSVEKAPFEIVDE